MPRVRRCHGAGGLRNLSLIRWAIELPPSRTDCALDCRFRSRYESKYHADGRVVARTWLAGHLGEGANRSGACRSTDAQSRPHSGGHPVE